MSTSKVEFPNQAVNIQVVVRCRPPTTKEKLSQPMAVTVRSRHEVCVNMKCGQNTTSKVFKFDQVYDQEASQEQVYRGTIKPIVGEVLTGYNCTVFAYGQTGTGKTYTMEGGFEDSNMAEGMPKLGKLAGMIPRAIQQIFHTLERSGCIYTVKLSILELYNEELHDMLAPDEEPTKDLGRRTKSKLRLFDDATRKGIGSSQAAGAAVSTGGSVTISGLEEVPVRKLSEVLDLMRKAMDRRQMAETKLNATSSRSHMITTVTLHLKETTDTGEDLWKVGKLNLVDLAGSENILRSGAHGKNQKEAGMINQSLLTLGRVINALVEGQPHVPYRESKLTRLLQDSLGGKTKTCIIATIAPIGACLEETASTLEYAHRAKSIKNRPEVNQRMTKKHVVKEMMETNEELQRLLMAARDKNGVYLPIDIYERQEEEKRLLRLQVQELEDELRNARSESRKKGNQLKRIAAVVEELQRQQTFLAEGNQTHLQAFEDFYMGCTSKLDADMRELHRHSSSLMREVANVIQTTLGWVNKLAEEQQSGLSTSDLRLKGLMGSVLASAETIKQWCLKIMEEVMANSQETHAHIGTMRHDITQANVACAQMLQMMQNECQTFLSTLGNRLTADVGEAQHLSMKILQGHAAELCECHARAVPQVQQGIQRVLGSQMQSLANGLQEMHCTNWTTFESALQNLTTALSTFVEVQQSNRVAQESHLKAMTQQISGVAPAVDEAVKTELSVMHDAVVENTNLLHHDAHVAMEELDDTLCSIRNGMTPYAESVNRHAEQMLASTQSVGTIVGDFADIVTHQHRLLGNTMQYNNSVVEENVRKLVKFQDAATQNLLSSNKTMKERALDFATRLPEQIKALDSSHNLEEHHHSIEELVPGHQEGLQHLVTGCHTKVTTHSDFVGQFISNQQTTIQPILVFEEYDDSDSDNDMDEAFSTNGTQPSRTQSASTPLVDLQGRCHHRTPLQELVNREFFSGGKHGSPGRTPANGKLMSPTSGRMPSDLLSPARPLFTEEMEVL